MQLFLELTRRCNTQCNHCLRGDAQGEDMSEHTLITALQTFQGSIDWFGFGGGETLLNSKYLKKFRHCLIWSAVNFSFMEPTWLVTNGIRLINDLNIQTAIIELSQNIPITIAVSIDSYHPDNAKARYHEITDIFEYYDTISVVFHGPTNSNGLISMGRAENRGSEVKLYSDHIELYININGDVFPSCDLSYNFMDRFLNTPIHFGNIHTNTYQEIMNKDELLSMYINQTEDKILYLNEHWNGFEPDTLQEFNELKITLKNERLITTI